MILRRTPRCRPGSGRRAAVPARTVARRCTRLLAVTALTAIWTIVQADPGTPVFPPSGGDVVVGVVSEPVHLNPAVTTAGPVHAVTASIFNGLVGLDQNADPVPELAEKWRISGDGKVYTFYLRQDVRWHDGTPFTAADVKFTFEEMLLKFHARTRAGLRGNLAEITTPNPHTVVFRFHRGYAPLLHRLDVMEAPILPRHIYRGQDALAAPANHRPVGTGPFRFDEWMRGSYIRLTRNERYFRNGRPYLDRVAFRFLPTTAAAVIALEVGELDYLSVMSGVDIDRLRASKNISVKHTAGNGYCVTTLIPNLRKPPLQRAEVRQALNFAIDRQFILDRVYFGAGRVARGPIHSQIAWFDPALPAVHRDLARANRFLDDAGYPPGSRGIRFSLRFAYSHAGYSQLANALKAQLAQVGIDLVLKPGETNTVTERVYVKNDFDLGIASLCHGPDPDIGVKRIYHSSNILPIPFGNGAGYRNAEIDALFDRAAGSMDRAKRAALYREIQGVLSKELPYFWLIETDGYRAYRNHIDGLQIWTGNALEKAYLTR